MSATRRGGSADTVDERDALGAPDAPDAPGAPGDLNATDSSDASDESDAPDASDASDAPSASEARRARSFSSREQREANVRRARRRLLLPVLLAILGVVLTAGGVALLVRAHQQSSDQSTTDQAVVDQAATSVVIGQVSAALNRVLSYDYTKPDDTKRAASELLTGDAATQYTTLFTALQSKAPGQQLTLTAKTVVAGVMSLHGSTAQLLVFLDQTSTRASDKATSTSAAQLQVTAVENNGNWRVSELLPL